MENQLTHKTRIAILKHEHLPVIEDGRDPIRMHMSLACSAPSAVSGIFVHAVCLHGERILHEHDPGIFSTFTPLLYRHGSIVHSGGVRKLEIASIEDKREVNCWGIANHSVAG